MNRCLSSLNVNKSCSLSLKILPPPPGVTYTQIYQVSASSQIKDSLTFIIKGPDSTNLSCSYNSQIYPHDSAIPGFSSTSVSYGNLCSSIAVSGICNNGIISNQPSSPTCIVESLLNCQINSQTIFDGSFTSFDNIVYFKGRNLSTLEKYVFFDTSDLSITLIAGVPSIWPIQVKDSEFENKIYFNSNTTMKIYDTNLKTLSYLIQILVQLLTILFQFLGGLDQFCF